MEATPLPLDERTPTDWVMAFQSTLSRPGHVRTPETKRFELEQENGRAIMKA